MCEERKWEVREMRISEEEMSIFSSLRQGRKGNIGFFSEGGTEMRVKLGVGYGFYFPDMTENWKRQRRVLSALLLLSTMKKKGE